MESTATVASDQSDDLSKNLVAGGGRQVEHVAAAVVGAQIEADADAGDLHAASLPVTIHHVPEVVLEVVRIVGEVGRAALVRRVRGGRVRR